MNNYTPLFGNVSNNVRGHFNRNLYEENQLHFGLEGWKDYGPLRERNQVLRLIKVIDL